VGLERAIDFGVFAELGRGMLAALEWLHRATGNWGWAIVLLTLALQTLLLPLTWKSLRAAAVMRKVQPEISRLQQRYADEPQKLNAEMMELYKRAGANPLGGCLPMVLQMPIFIALFNALRNSWELHGTGWILWIHDLSAKDPFYALPIVMGGLMYFQGKLNPPAGDPSQQKMMAMMPLVFTFMFLKFPSGLVLYWLTNSLVSTTLQLALKDRLEA
jgi:YidC/Oxa1 family membrane protein insertase